jgi:hypothetical protein
MPTPICPSCKKPAEKTPTKYGPRYQCCDLWSWGKFPLVSSEIHELRKKAHTEFDPIWQCGTITRTQAYIHLTRGLGIRKEKCHMKLMGRKQLLKVLEIVKQYKEEVYGTEPSTKSKAS